MSNAQNPLRITTLLSALAWLTSPATSGAADALDTWTPRTSGTTNQLNAIMYSGSAFWAVGDAATVLTSTNGADWVSRGWSAAPTPNLTGIAGGGGLFVVVSDGQMFTSPDGGAWTLNPQPPPNLRSVTYGGGRFVAVGSSGRIVTSTDGITWATQIYSSAPSLQSITFKDGFFLIVAGSPSMVLGSNDGSNWNNLTPRFSMPSLRGVTGWDRGFIAVGGSNPVAIGGLIISSPDGLGWVQCNPGYPTLNFYSVAGGSGVAVAVGGGIMPDTRIILSSRDGIAWTTRLLQVNSRQLLGVAYGNGGFVAVGPAGTILQSGPVFALAANPPSTGRGSVVTINGEIGRTYRIQATTNLAPGDWEEIGTLTNTTPGTPFLDSTATNVPGRFYRAVSP